MTNLCKTIDTYTDVNGAMPLLYSIRDCIPYAYSGLLLGIFFLLVAGSYFLNKNRVGRGNIFNSLMGSSVVLILLSALLALAGLVTYKVCLFWAFIAIICYILLETSN